jgi:peptidoglycan/LPS O-acetylase OafA/YrhL
LRLLERVCAVIAVLYATLLALFTTYDALLITYRNGDLTPTIAVFTGACVGWLGLRLVRSPRRPPIGLFVGGVCAVGLVVVLWWTTHPPVEEKQHVTPSPSTGGLKSQPPDGAPGTAPLPAPPTARP